MCPNEYSRTAFRIGIFDTPTSITAVRGIFVYFVTLIKNVVINVK